METKPESYKQKLIHRLEKFSILIIRLCSVFPKTPAGFAIASQLIRSSTSIGANMIEAQDASSRKDFLHDVNISLREAKETQYWLSLVHASFQNLSSATLNELEKENAELVALLTSTVRKTKQSL